MRYEFLDGYGSFITSGVVPKTAYFPVCNARFLGSVNVDLAGDLKTDQDHFFLPPVSRIDLTASKLTPNVWLRFPRGLYSLLGVSNTDLNRLWPVRKRVEAGLGWFRLWITCGELGLEASLTTYIPPDEDVQIFWLKIKSQARKDLSFVPIFTVPVYARSGDNLRDHRHVTSLLNRVRILSNGLLVKPTMSFDERGHRLNEVVYGVLASTRLADVYSAYEDVVGEGDLLNPLGLLKSSADRTHIQGKEVVAGLVFPEVCLQPGEGCELVCGLFMGKEGDERIWNRSVKRDPAKGLKKVQEFWRGYVDSLRMDFPSQDFSNWLVWVGAQPWFRKVYGCSFLPDFDYGRGGRGWRDLWQDLLGLLLRDPGSAREEILNNFNGVRIDGSNATIIGKGRGEFVADRNRITRVWMDHGVWPWETLKLYIDQTGDWQILFEKARYFRDAQIFRAGKYDTNWNGAPWLTTTTGEAYEGSILEHLLVQHLVQAFNLGEHGMIRLEDADWNDGLDMARERGESVAFTHFYAGNLEEMAELLEAIADKVKSVRVLKELDLLLYPPADEDPREVLKEYFHLTQERGITGETTEVGVRELVRILRERAGVMRERLLSQELIEVEGERFFNGYYDNLGRRVCGKVDGRVRMTLTGQVFAIMKGTASEGLSRAIAKAVDRFLYDPSVGGYRLNTDFGQIYPELGRAFAFSFGEKENGAVFSHMVVMYANALLRRGLVAEAKRPLLSLFRLATDSERSQVFPCLPEYFNNEARGMYAYLTGSASWYVFTLFREVLGISSSLGDLLLWPRIPKEMFFAGDAIECGCTLLGRRVLVRFLNPEGLDYEEYVIRYLRINRRHREVMTKKVKVPREELDELLKTRGKNTIEVVLGCAG